MPSPPFRATGRLGTDQLARCAELLERTQREQLFRVVLIHHPPVTRPARHKERLIDGKAFLDVLGKHGAELVLHGHEHAHSVQWFDGPERPVPVVGVPSASGAAGGRYEPAAYNLYSIDRGPGGWRCEMVSRGLALQGDTVLEINRTLLAGV